MSQCLHLYYALRTTKKINVHIAIARCNDCNSEGLRDQWGFSPFTAKPSACHHTNCFKADSVHYCSSCGEEGTHNGVMFVPNSTNRVLTGAKAIIKFNGVPITEVENVTFDHHVDLSRFDDESPVPLPEPPKVNPENPLGCECGAWVVGQNQYGRGHDSFCKLRRD